jgi:hypothetical protein
MFTTFLAADTKRSAMLTLERSDRDPSRLDRNDFDHASAPSSLAPALAPTSENLFHDELQEHFGDDNFGPFPLAATCSLCSHIPDFFICTCAVHIR